MSHEHYETYDDEEEDYVETETTRTTLIENAFNDDEAVETYDELLETREIDYEHPLQDTGSGEYVEQYESWQQDEDVIEEEVVTTKPVIEDKPDGDVTQTKGFQNARETESPVNLQVFGALPTWLKGDLFTVGPGTYDINYPRKIEVDGLLQTATAKYSFEHWFDSLPLVNRFDIDGPANQISYRSRLTSKRLISKIRDHHGYAPSHPAGLFRSDTNQSVLIKLVKAGVNHDKPDYEPCGACITPWIPGIEGRLFCLNNANQVQELDPFDLHPTRLFSWDHHNPAFRGYTASPHAQYDATTGEWINFTQDVGYQTTAYHFFSVSESNPKGSVITSVTARTSFVHSFALTGNYIVLAVFPLIANYAGLKFTWNESVLDSFTFTPSEPTLFYVISREKKKHILTYRSDAAFAFHHINAFEDGSDNVILDLACYKDTTIAHQMALPALRFPAEMEPPGFSAAQVRRYTLPRLTSEARRFASNNGYIPTASTLHSSASGLWGAISSTVGLAGSAEGKEKSGTGTATGWYSWLPEATFEIVVDRAVELPQVNPKFKFHRYRFLYGVGLSEKARNRPGCIWDSIVKADLSRKTAAATWQRDHCYPSEPLFVPRPSAADGIQTVSPPKSADEDDGALLSIVLDSERNRSFLLVLDARTLEELGRADLPAVVPISFAHGSFKAKA